MFFRTPLKVHHYFDVNLLYGPEDPEVLTSESFNTIYDCNAFIHWLSCQVSTAITYQIVEYTKDGPVYIMKPYPICKKRPTKCKHFPPQPLLRDVLRRRRAYREENGYYYEYT